MQIAKMAWCSAKRLRKLKIGPVSLQFQFRRSKQVSSNTMRRFIRCLHKTIIQTKAEASTDILSQESQYPSLENKHSSCNQISLIVGVGPGFGYSVAKKLARAGHRVAVASRNAERLDPLVKELEAEGLDACAYGCDATDESSVKKLFSHISRDYGIPNLVVFSVQYFSPGRTVEVELPAFEDAWRNNCLGGFLVAREACQLMLGPQRGTVILVGSTSSLIGRENHLNLAVGKFGLRALAQVLAREVWPSGIHVAHLVIDADINEGSYSSDEDIPQANPDHIADLVLSLHRQPSSAWTSEIDIRPSREKFWEHC